MADPSKQNLFSARQSYSPEGQREGQREDQGQCGASLSCVQVSRILGGSLKAARLQKNLELEAIAADLCIRPRYLKALEADCFGDLPDDVCTIGFLRSYAEFLDLDADGLIAIYRKRLGVASPIHQYEVDSSANSSSSFSVSGTFSSHKASGLFSAALGIIGLVIVWGISADLEISGMSQDMFQGPLLVTDISGIPDMTALQGSDKSLVFAIDDAGNKVLNTSAGHQNLEPKSQISLDLDRGNKESYSTSPVAATLVAATPEIDVTTKSTSENSLIRKEDIIPDDIITGANSPVFVATRDVWLSLVTPSGTPVWEGVLSSGDVYRPAAGVHLRLTVSDAGALTLLQNGQKRPMGQRGLMLHLSDIDLIKAAASTLSDA